MIADRAPGGGKGDHNCVCAASCTGTEGIGDLQKDTWCLQPATAPRDGNLKSCDNLVLQSLAVGGIY